MKKNELISIGERNLQLHARFIFSKRDEEKLDYQSYHLYSIQYTNFCHLDLNISQFVPAIKVGDKWEVLEMPEYRDTKGMSNAYSIDFNLGFDEAMEEYQTAKDNVIFEGCISAEYKDGLFYLKFNNDFTLVFQDNDTIEWLVDEEITLTKNGVEVSGLNNK